MTQKLILVDKKYYTESITDIERDVMESLDDDRLERDKHGFHKGVFKILFTWEPE